MEHRCSEAGGMRRRHEWNELDRGRKPIDDPNNRDYPWPRSGLRTFRTLSSTMYASKRFR
ncbi:hypothetical protein BOSEA1005_21447 [Hyphomicrobiales bacterium]|nr:hypothetical protein BOSEA1005_21447 [Hyphomicrobiales bacterium]